MGVILKMYANESKGNKFPPAPPFALKYQTNGLVLYPEYLTDVKILVCPSDATTNATDVAEALAIVAAGDPNGVYAADADFSDPIVQKAGLHFLTSEYYSYAYFPWTVTTDGGFVAFEEAWRWIRNNDPTWNACGGWGASCPVGTMDQDVDMDGDAGFAMGTLYEAYNRWAVPLGYPGGVFCRIVG